MLNAISFTNADSDQPKKLTKYERSTYWNGKCLVVVPVFARARLCLYFFLMNSVVISAGFSCLSFN